MPDDQPQYYQLFRSINDAIEILDSMIVILKQVQRAAEEAYIAGSDPPALNPETDGPRPKPADK